MKITDWLNTQLNDASTVLETFVVFAITIVVLISSLKGGLGFASILMALLTAALVWWALIGGGIEFVGGLIETQADGK